MRRLKVGLGLTAVLLYAGLAQAQSTTGTISGRVIDLQQAAVPGATVTVESPNLQGVRMAVTSETGDYVIPVLPSGTYTITFELSGFERQRRSVSLAPAQILTEDARLGPAPVEETLQVVGRAGAHVPTRTAQVATTFEQRVLSELPMTRDLNGAMLMAPSVHATGPRGAFSIAGAMSFESLFLVNGVTVNENVRGQAHDLYIEDAIQETTIATAGISAEYGRFSGGVVNLITKSGGNIFSGSFRDSLTNDSWRALTPFSGDSTTDALLSTYEYTLGGPIMTDRLWFFTAGRLQNIEERRTLAFTDVPYDYANDLQRYEAKGTYSLRRGQRFEGAYTRFFDDASNSTFATTSSMDLRSLYDAERRMDLLSLGYSGVVSPNLFVEARYSARNERLMGIGAPTQDIVNGTMLLDTQRGSRYWSPTFCGVCDPEDRDNQNVFVKGSYFLSRNGVGSHNVSFGFDSFNDHRFANRHQTGSDYRIYSLAILEGSNVAPAFLNDGTTVIQWNPIFVESQGANLRTHSLFLNDNWRVSSRVTANLGLRYDKNDGTNSAGDTIARDSAWSPRLGLVWDPTGSAQWAVSGSIARYVAPITSSIGDASSAAGNPDNYTYVYSGSPINAGGSIVTPTEHAVDQVFDWFFANGGTNRPLSSGAYPIPVIVSGVSPLIRGGLISPNVLEYAGGVSRQFNRASLRVDLIHRDYQDFYVARADTSTGIVQDPLGRSFDLTLIENGSDLKRRYLGLNFQATYRAGTKLDLGATYTVARAWGNVEGENANAGPTADLSLSYPEYKQASWNYPEGDLSIDQRHRARIWATYLLPWVPGLSVSALQTLETGAPYGAVASSVPVAPYVSNPGYARPPSGSVYYLTARDAFRTEGQKRTDFAVNYIHNMRGLGSLQLFGQLQVINLFNQSQLCACGQGVALNGGAIDLSRIDQTVSVTRTAPFNPFTTTPVEGTNWTYGDNFGKAVNRFAYTMPRSLRLSFGVRF
jgi:outer membrane receptor for ferrienterochelin and colicin